MNVSLNGADVASYYARTTSTNTDGSPVFSNSSDEESQQGVADAISRAWGPGLVLKPFGRLSPIDYYAERDGRVVAVIEVKSRSHDSGKYETVFLNVRKWIALQLASIGMGVPAFFFVMFTDRLMYMPIWNVEASAVRIGGTTRTVKSRSDREPIIDVPVQSMKEATIVAR